MRKLYMIKLAGLLSCIVKKEAAKIPLQRFLCRMKKEGESAIKKGKPLKRGIKFTILTSRCHLHQQELNLQKVGLY